jgi:hypothetical protein
MPSYNLQIYTHSFHLNVVARFLVYNKTVDSNYAKSGLKNFECFGPCSRVAKQTYALFIDTVSMMYIDFCGVTVQSI